MQKRPLKRNGDVYLEKFRDSAFITFGIFFNVKKNA